jgi:hypothetical protein
VKRVSKLSSAQVKYIAGLYFEGIHDVNSMMKQYLEGTNVSLSKNISNLMDVILDSIKYKMIIIHQMEVAWLELLQNKTNIPIEIHPFPSI